MPFDPILEEVADTVLFDNILAIVKRDMKAALDEKFPDEDLPDFAQRTLGRLFKLGSYPVFALDPDRNGPQHSADGSWVEDAVRIQAFIAVNASDGPTATRLAAMYATAFKSIMRKAAKPPAADFLTGVPAGAVFAFTLELSYEYGLIGKNAHGYEKPVSFDLLLKFNER